MLTAPDAAASDRFGTAVAIDGDTAIVGAYLDDGPAGADQGAAYIYRWDGAEWVFEAKLTASDAAAGDAFGVSVALSGDTAIVGAQSDDGAAGADQGSAYVFTRSGTLWTQQAKLTAADGAPGDSFGISVAVSGDTAIVGASYDSVGANFAQGSAYVLTRSGTVWTQQAQLTAFFGEAGDGFGFSVALDGDTALVGAIGDDIGANAFRGSACVFIRFGATWAQQAQLIASDGATGDNFGSSVALSGDTALVGAWFDDVGANADQGSAYVFARFPALGWTQQTKLTASDGAAGDHFGWSVALSGDKALVGAYSDDAGANGDQGSAYFFVPPVDAPGTWTEQAKLIAFEGAAGDEFGHAVAIDGDTAIVGALGDDVGGIDDQGSARVFRNRGGVWRESDLALTAIEDEEYDNFGFSVAIDGDTMIIGAPFDDIGSGYDRGSAHIYRWNGASWVFEATLRASDGRYYDQFGWSVALSGDTAIVGAPNDTVGENYYQGSAYIFTRAGTAWTQEVMLTASDGQYYDQFGWSVALSGDTAIVGVPFDFVGENYYQGSAYIFTRSGSVWTQQAKLTAFDAAAGDEFGVSVALSGDTALVGAVYDDGAAGANQGSAYVFTRSGTLWTQQAKLEASDAAVFDNFGSSVALSGDTAIVGAQFGDGAAGADQGSAYVFTRAGTSWTEEVKLTAADGQYFDLFGWSVAVSGETALVGAYLADIGTSADQGAAYTFTRSIRGAPEWTLQAKLATSDDPAHDLLGTAVAFDDNAIIVGASSDDIGANTNEGSAHIYRWNGAQWVHEAALLASDGAAFDGFGTSVAIFGDTAVVGAIQDRVGATDGPGAAYVFTRTGTVWTQQAKLFAADGATSDFFGSSIALSGGTVLVGSPFNDVVTNTDQGAAYVFTRTGTVWTQQAKLFAADGAAGDSFGSSVALSGDTALLGAIGASSQQGSAYIFTCADSTWTEQAGFTASDGGAGDLFGYSVALSGHTALVGAIGSNSKRGSAYVFARSGAVWTQQAQLIASDGAAGDGFGVSVALSGDAGIVGAAEHVGENFNQGAAYIFMRSSAAPGWTELAKLSASDGGVFDEFGRAVALSSDVAIAGAPGDTIDEHKQQGSARVFRREGGLWRGLGDANSDRLVDMMDLMSVLTFFGAMSPPGTSTGDADGNGLVNFYDVLSVLANFGAVCP